MCRLTPPALTKKPSPPQRTRDEVHSLIKIFRLFLLHGQECRIGEDARCTTTHTDRTQHTAHNTQHTTHTTHTDRFTASAGRRDRRDPTAYGPRTYTRPCEDLRPHWSALPSSVTSRCRRPRNLARHASPPKGSCSCVCVVSCHDRSVGECPREVEQVLLLQCRQTRHGLSALMIRCSTPRFHPRLRWPM